MNNKMEFAKLNAKAIGEHEFSVEYKGYKVEEVDQFLDRVIEDYTFYQFELEKKEREVKSLKNDLANLQERLNDRDERLAEATERLNKAGQTGEANKMLLRRINDLEKKVDKK